MSEEILIKFFCNVVKQNIKSFCYGLNPCNPDRARVIVGHCPQHFSTKNRTFNDIKNEGNIVEIIDGSIYEGTADIQNFKVFGISMECEIENKNDAHLYRLDVGVSRTYDDLKEFNKILDVPKYMEPIKITLDDYMV